MKTADKIASLQSKLPRWHFEAYGQLGAIACYPPDQDRKPEAYSTLAAHAVISSVCGPLYVITQLH